MTFSYSAVWNDTTALLRRNASLIVAIAGVFIFLPSLLMGYFLPPPQGGETLDPMVEFIFANLHWYLLAQLVSMVGAIAILTLIFRKGGVTVAGAIGNGFAVLPFYLLALLLARFAIAAGLFALIIPGLYLVGRLAPVGPMLLAENLRNPIDVIARSFRLTSNKGWIVFGLIFLVFVAGMFLVLALTFVFGILALIGGGGVGQLLSLILNSAISTAFAVVLIVLFAAITRSP